jgi:hypothetical protein
MAKTTRTKRITKIDLRRDVPLLITRAGRDQFPAMNASIDRFIRQGLIENLPMTVVNHAQGRTPLISSTAVERRAISSARPCGFYGST